MESAVAMAIEAARAASADRVLALHLRVGAMSGVVPDAMRFAFEIVSRDTIVAGAALEIEAVPAVWWCRKCRAEFECDDFVAECSRCHHLSRELRHGRELEIASVKLE